MRKLVAALLLFSLTFSWGGALAAAYCQHEATPVEQKHFGHHGDYCGKPDQNETDRDATKNHTHCSMNQLSAGALLLELAAIALPSAGGVAYLPVLFSLPIPVLDEPERPNWTPFA